MLEKDIKGVTMNCIKCNGSTSVVDSRPQETSAVKRRRKCCKCGHRFSTIEQVLTGVALAKKAVIANRIVKINKPRNKPRNIFNDDSYLDPLSDDDSYFDSLSDDELESLIGGEDFETYR